MKQLLKIVYPLIGKKGALIYAFLGMVSGASSFLFINSVTKFIAIIMGGNYTTVSREYVIIFSGIILLFVWSRRAFTIFSIDVTQKISWSLRKEILSLAINSNYHQLAKRKSLIQAAILNDVSVLTGASMAAIDFFIQVIMAISCLFYMASISYVLLVITLLVAALGIAAYFITLKRNMVRFEEARKVENSFQLNLNAILDGFKEIFMEPRKGKYIYKHKILKNADDSYQNNSTALIGLTDNQMIGQILFYIFIASVLLFFSISLDISSDKIVGFVFTLLYLLGAISTIVALLPGLMRATVSADQLVQLKRDMRMVAASEQATAGKQLLIKHFNEIRVSDLQFDYGKEEYSFAIGPISMSIQPGDVIFIYGGNGSGKTTFMHALLGLYNPSAGEIRLDDMLVRESNYIAYRSLFAVVFTDYYLFHELLTTEAVDISEWNYYVSLFELDGKVELEGRNFSSIDLSAGQKKRLALIVALMEKKPVLVLDEWAADQDPYFRRKFYEKIIPLLKQKGITVIAITHDDKYYHISDKLYKMEEGKLMEESVYSHQ